MQEAELYDELTEIFRQAFSRQDLTLKPGLTAKDVQGWDSFKTIEIIMAVESKYGVKFRARELEGLRSVGDIARTILTKTADRR
jgi:acyl carrier protein